MGRTPQEPVCFVRFLFKRTYVKSGRYTQYETDTKIRSLDKELERIYELKRLHLRIKRLERAK